MKLKDISKSYGCRFAFENDDPLIPYMILNGQGLRLGNGRRLRLGFVSFVDLNNGNIASFLEGDSILEHPVVVNKGYEIF